MPTEKEIFNAMGQIEGLIEKDPLLDAANKEKALKLVNTVRTGLYAFHKSARDLEEQIESERQNKEAVARVSSADGVPATVNLEIETDYADADNFGNAYVHVISTDGADYRPAKAFRGASGVCIEFWPIPKSFTMTLPELRALVAELEKWRDRLPYHDGSPGIQA